VNALVEGQQRVSSVRFREWLLNYFAALGVLALAYTVYTLHPYYRGYFTVAQRQWLEYAFWGYVALLPLYYMTLPAAHAAKCRLLWRACWHLRVRWPTQQEKVAILAIVVKLFYLPLMIGWLWSHSAELHKHWDAFLLRGGFFPEGYWLLFNFAFLVDVACFTLGYAVEHPKLGNEIRSVEPTVAGWLVTLICYPPFNDVTRVFLGWHSSDYPDFSALWAQYIAAAAILALMTVYAWASVALWLKASNLTHRGIVEHGPYRWIRHPAYGSKNLAWWIGAIPVLMMQWQAGPQAFWFAVFGMAGWTLIYYLRAITEERHLGLDADYRAYCQRVRWRFIPGLW
jgi:protein-S-isoprenylcysteine O-methyltransferase Ste14